MKLDNKTTENLLNSHILAEKFKDQAIFGSDIFLVCLIVMQDYIFIYYEFQYF